MSKIAYQKLLDEAMGINTEIARLPVISEDIMLISYNAEAAAARAGDQGRSLHVLTAEIHQLADVISESVHYMTDQVMHYTRNMAKITNNHNRQHSYARARALMGDTGEADGMTHSLVDGNIEVIVATNRELLGSVPHFLATLEKNVEEIRRRIKLGEIISTNVSIEVASMMTGAQEVKVFKLLAEKLLTACKEMRGIVELCDKRLTNIHTTLRTVAL